MTTTIQKAHKELAAIEMQLRDFRNNHDLSGADAAGSYIDDIMADMEEAVSILAVEAQRQDEAEGARDQAEYERQHRLTGQQLGVI
ncbi:MAG: hypothetical protein GC149_20475 [Gammaproteobacteria bacterium]|nr:hypothetical protein [Gammaproteobacteria bacterium]